MDKYALYRQSLTMFCIYAAEIQRMAEQIKQGVRLSKGRAAFVCSMAEEFKKNLLSDMAVLGFCSERRDAAIEESDGPLAFMEDNRFQGFEIKGGRIIGDPERVYPIVRKWIEGFPDKANHYQFEVAVYALCLSDPNLIRMVIPAERKITETAA